MSEKKITRIEGGVTAAEGFEAAAAAAGIKYQGRDDMALIYSGTLPAGQQEPLPPMW